MNPGCRYRRREWRFRKARVLAILAMALTLISSTSAASNFKLLHSFPNNDGKDGDEPTGALILDSSGNLYGTAEGGGSPYSKACIGGCGVVFKMTPTARGAWAESVLHSFDAGVDGAFPGPGLTFDGQGNLYGTTSSGSGNNDGGTAFELSPDSSSPDGWITKVIHRFCHNFHGCKDGSDPEFAGVAIDSSGRLYGTTREGGTTQGGVAYRLALTNSEWKEAVLYTFCSPNCGDGNLVAEATPILDKADNLYGTAEEGGLACSCGLIFEVKHTATGWQEIILYEFHGSDGFFPSGGLIFDAAGNLYGTTRGGGTSSCDCGTIFKLTPDSHGGWTHSILYSFTDANKNGAVPFTTLLMDKAGSFYGTAEGGIGPCNGGCGVVFKLALGSNGKWQYSVLHRFTDATNDGAEPYSGLIFDKAEKHLYGTTAFGGTYNQGTVYEITP